jgi:hypothetical protein
MPTLIFYCFSSSSFIYKDCFRGPDTVWQLEKKHSVDYFTLEDLWEHYSESSAYGLAVPVRLHHQTTGKSITQHFVPYLSAIQIYTAKALAAVPRFALLILSKLMPDLLSYHSSVFISSGSILALSFSWKN